MRWLLIASLAVLVFSPRVARAEETVWLQSWDAHGRPFDLRSQRGRIVAITFASRHTRDEAAEVNDALVDKGIEVVSVIDLADVPGIARGSAQKQVGAYDRATQINLLDNTGALAHDFHVAPMTRVDILIVDGNGALRGRYAGIGQLDQALQQIDLLKADQAAKR